MDEAEAAAFRRSLGKRLRLLRLVRELSQAELAEAAGLTRNQVSAFERAAQGLDVVALMGLAAALRVPVAELLDVGAPVADRAEGLPS
jgi:transcriptional regulator with XRE-family HTH domain